jgi:hypothetical protein
MRSGIGFEVTGNGSVSRRASLLVIACGDGYARTL